MQFSFKMASSPHNPGRKRAYGFTLVFFLCLELFCVKIEGASIKPQIIGGTPAIPGEFPFVVAVWQIYNDDDDFKHNSKYLPPSDNVCVGTLISESRVLTAAHCVNTYSINNLAVIAGAYNVSANESTQQMSRVLAKKVHPCYTQFSGTTRNDIAILEIEPLNINLNVSPLRLPPSGHEVPGHGSCKIMGWGQTATAIQSQILLKATVPIVQEDKCIKIYPDLLDSVIQLCAGHDEGGYDACLYDTGGPLLCNDLGYNYIAGIVSWGKYCGSPMYPGVYTKVSRYIDWIQSV